METLTASPLSSRFGALVLTGCLIGATAGCGSSNSSPPKPAVGSRSPAQSNPVVASNSTNPALEPGSSTVDDSANEKATSGTPPEQPAASKSGRAPIYNELTDARADIRAALDRAAYDHKRVLVKFGGNWCGWCFKLHDVFKKDAAVAPVLRGEYELVLVDINTNRDLLKEYDPHNDSHGYPWLTVLDAEGRVLVNQNTADLEEGPHHDPQKVLAFLSRWQAPQQTAEETLAAGLETAQRQEKRVLVHLGAPWCGWCHVLDRFLLAHRDLVGIDYVDVKIDTTRMADGPQVAARLRHDQPGGIPWFAILDADGKTLTTSDGPGGNIGYPFQPQEIEYFIKVLKQTRQRLDDEQLGSIDHDLRDYAAKKNGAH